MSKIKVRNIAEHEIKTLNKAVVGTEKLKDNIVRVKDKLNSDNDSISDYGNDAISSTTSTLADKSVSSFNGKGYKSVLQTKDNISKAKLKIKSFRDKNLKKKANKVRKETIKTSQKAVKTTGKTAKQTIKASKKTMMVAKNTIKTTARGIKATASSIKAIIAGTKALISALITGGWIALAVVIVICLIGLLVSSVYGIFFSSEDIGNNVKMSDCINELNIEMDNRIREIERGTPHDEVVIESKKAEWKDVLAIYTIKVSGDNQDVVTIDNKKKAILRQVFWDMNSISSEVITEMYNEDTSIDFIGNRNKSVEKRVLHIRINSKSINDMKVQYGFNKNQLKQLSELTSDKNQSLWNYAIFGNYASSKKAENWKQKGESWSNIKIGHTNKTIGDIGCLVTSIAILIKKSGVSTGNINPFNPGSFVQALNNSYGFDRNGGLLYGPISNLIPYFKYTGRVDISNKSKVDKLNEIKRYYDAGYYLAIKVVDTNNSQHWVALDEIKNDTIIMSDPGSKKIDMWSAYNWINTTQFVYFKAN